MFALRRCAGFPAWGFGGHSCLSECKTKVVLPRSDKTVIRRAVERSTPSPSHKRLKLSHQLHFTRRKRVPARLLRRLGIRLQQLASPLQSEDGEMNTLDSQHVEASKKLSESTSAVASGLDTGK
jgi:hypothetical protein